MGRSPHVPLRLPSGSIRLRLTAVYATLFLASGAVLLSVTYVLVRQATGNDAVRLTLGPGKNVVVAANGLKGNVAAAPSGAVVKASGAIVTAGPGIGTARQTFRVEGPGGKELPPIIDVTRREAQAQLVRLEAQAKQQRDHELRQLTEKSAVALGLMAVLSIVLGWLAAGRVLRPLRTLNERARRISATSLHKRLALTGPDDELKRLADTFDELLGRLESSFAAQRQFVANASHELRTPLARARTIAEVALADPGATVQSLRESHERVLAAGEQQERLIEALLTLARSERGLDEREPLDLAEIAETVLLSRRPEAELRGLRLEAALAPAPTAGDERLAERLVANLVDNALRHNVPHGALLVSTTTRNGQAIVSVANTGPSVPAGELQRLFLPFQRLGGDRTSHGDGAGLGLSIVQAIATAHGASLTARPRPEGGLTVHVAFPGAGCGPGEERSGDAVAGGILEPLSLSPVDG